MSRANPCLSRGRGIWRHLEAVDWCGLYLRWDPNLDVIVDVVTDSVVHLTSDVQSVGQYGPMQSWTGCFLKTVNCLFPGLPSIFSPTGKPFVYLRLCKLLSKLWSKLRSKLWSQAVTIFTHRALYWKTRRHDMAPVRVFWYFMASEMKACNRRNEHITPAFQDGIHPQCVTPWESSIAQVQDCRQIVNQPIHLQAADFAQSGLFFCFSLRFVPDIRCQSCSWMQLCPDEAYQLGQNTCKHNNIQ